MIPLPPSDPLWKGPIEDGCTQSIINKFLQCPFRFYLYAILGLEEDTPPHPNLVWGDCYHVGLEHLIQGDSLRDSQLAAINYLDKEYGEFRNWTDDEGKPLFNYESYRKSIPLMLSYYDTNIIQEDNLITEDSFNVKFQGYRFRGKRDVHAPDEAIGEHKAKKQISIDPVLLKEEITQDLQCNIYMRISEVEKVYYDLIGIPESVKYGAPYKARNRTDAEYIQDCIIGGDYKPNKLFPICDNLHAWVHQSVHFIPHASQEKYWQQTVIPIVKRMHQWYDYVTDPNFDPNNPEHYNEVFFRMPVRIFLGSNTEKFKCEYHSYLTEQEEICNLREVSSMYKELE